MSQAGTPGPWEWAVLLWCVHGNLGWRAFLVTVLPLTRYWIFPFALPIFGIWDFGVPGPESALGFSSVNE